MRARLITRILTLAAVVVGLLAVPVAAFAYAPTGADFITCVAGGDANVECTAGVFDPNTDVVVTTPEGEQTRLADSEGVISFNFDAEVLGVQLVNLRGTQDGETKVLADEVATVDAEGEVIANAGSDAGLLAIGAVAAIGLGGAALFASRRNRSNAAA